MEIRNGSFPPLFINNLSISLNPVFQYYSALFYILSGAINIIDPNTADAFVATIFIFLAYGVFGIFATARMLDISPVPAALGALSLLLTPYLLTDIFVRLAMAEISFWCVLPSLLAALLYFIRTVSYRSAFLLTLVLIILISTHKIFFGWTLLILILMLPVVFGVKRLLILSPSLALIGAIALLVDAPYIIEPLREAGSMSIANGAMFFMPLTAGYLPFRLDNSLPDALNIYTYFSLRLGYLGLLAICIIAVGVRRSLVLRSLALPMVVVLCVLTSLFGMVGSLEAVLPRILAIIQFPYRLLLFVSVLSALALALFMDTKPHRAIKIVALLTISVLQISVFGMFPSIVEKDPTDLVKESSDFSSSHFAADYRETVTPLLAEDPKTRVDRSAFLVAGNRAVADVDISAPGWVALPLLYNHLLEVKVDGVPQTPVMGYLAPGLDFPAVVAAIKLPAGRWHIEAVRRASLPFDQRPWLLLSVALLAFTLRLTRRLDRIETLTGPSVATSV